MNAGVQHLVILIVLYFIVTNGSARVIYVTPEKEHSCPRNTQLCYTLSHIAENPMKYFSSNTKIIFLPGNHTIDTNRSIIIANVSNITLEGSGSTIQSINGIEIELGFVFLQITNLSITNLCFYQCGAVLPMEVQLETQKIIKHSELIYYNEDFYTKNSPTLYLIQVTNIMIFRVGIYNSTGPGLLGFNVIGHSTISQSSFIRNNPNCALLFMDNTSFTPGHQSAELSILDSKLLHGRFFPKDIYYKALMSYPVIAAGLSATAAQTSYTVILNISNVTAYANNGILSYGNLFFYCNGNGLTIHLHRINCSHSNGTGLILDSVTSLISQSYFSQNSHAVDIIRTVFTVNPTGVITIVNTTFYNNSLALKLDNSNATLNSVSFLHNRAETYNSGTPIKVYAGSVRFQGNTIFLRNRGKMAGAVYALASSQLYIEGNVQFVENEGNDGGAIALYEQSEMILTHSVIAHINFKAIFTRNHARHYGGAIYVDEVKTTKPLQCFYSLEYKWQRSIANKTALVFTNNTSGVAGSAIYGGWVKLCAIRPKLQSLYSADIIFEKQFVINTDTSDLSPVSSEPVRVCICSDSKPVCNITYHTVKAYPGETFQISAVGVGQMYGTVPSTIHAEFHQTNATVKPNLENLQLVQIIEQFCSLLSYTVKSSNAVEDIILTVQSSINKELVAEMNSSIIFFEKSYKKQFYNLVIQINLQPCPLGFIMDNMVCVCYPQLQTLGILCNITTGRIYKDAQLWVNATFHKGVPNGVILHQNHPFDYCKPHSLNLSLDKPDEQCAFHRSGILCGACQHNLSHVLGSSNCKQ